MKVLIVTHAYAPDASPRAFRWTAIAEHWAGEGAEVRVVTTGRRGGAAVERRNGVTVHHAGERLMGRMHRGAGVSGAAQSRAELPATAGSAMLRRVLRAAYDTTWKRLFWPDYACLWYRPALALAKRLCRAERFDAAITVSHPFTGHLVGLSLKRAIPALRWVVDIGDPFSLDDTVPSNNTALYRGLNRRIDAAVLRECDAVSVTVEGCRAALADAFAIDPAKIRVIPPLLSLPEAAERSGTAPGYTSPDTIDLAYLGVLYPGIRPPDELLALFSAMHARQPGLRLHFFGDVQGCRQSFDRHAGLIGSAILLHGAIPRKRVAATMAAADVLVNIGNGTTHQLPSKLVEYLAAGRPVLNVARARQDTAADFLRDWPAALTVTIMDSAPTREQVGQALDFVSRPPAAAAEETGRRVAAFRIPAIAGTFARLVLAGTVGPVQDAACRQQTPESSR